MIIIKSKKKNDYNLTNRNLDNNIINDLTSKAYKQGYLSGFDFSILLQNLLVSKDGWVIDTGNYENVNAEVILRLIKRIKKHPRLWELFMVD